MELQCGGGRANGRRIRPQFNHVEEFLASFVPSFEDEEVSTAEAAVCQQQGGGGDGGVIRLLFAGWMDK